MALQSNQAATGNRFERALMHHGSTIQLTGLHVLPLCRPEVLPCSWAGRHRRACQAWLWMHSG